LQATRVEEPAGAPAATARTLDRSTTKRVALLHTVNTHRALETAGGIL